MKAALVSLATLLLVGCGASGGNDKPSNTAGSGSGGMGSGTAGNTGAGMSNGGGQAQAGSSQGGGDGGGSDAGGKSNGGSGGSGGGMTAKGFQCPAGPFEAPKLDGTPTRVAGVPPADAFNNNNNDFTNIEGDVWFDGALYVSEIAGAKPNPPPSRIIKITAEDQVSVVVPDSGSNGLAFDAAGQLYGTLHNDGSVSKLDLAAKTATPVVSMFMGKRFGSPNDLTFHSNGTLYFTDPGWQAPNPNPQTEQRAYWVAPGGQPMAIPGIGPSSRPNGISLSANQDFLYIAGQDPLKRFPVMADGSLGAGAEFGNGLSGIDGMAIDCADNIYAASGGQGVRVFDKTGKSLGTIKPAELGDATNVAFGGADHKTLYISGQGSGAQKGLFKLAMNVPGFPY